MHGHNTHRTVPPVWNGTDREGVDLLASIHSHCTCELNDKGFRVTSCAPHTMLTTDQRALDGLLFARRMVSRFRAEEFGATAVEPRA